MFLCYSYAKPIIIIKKEMLRKIKVNPEARIAHIPKELIDQGFKGDLDGYANAITLTIVSPNTPLEDVERSLEIVLDDIRFRRKREEKAKKKTEVSDGKRGGTQAEDSGQGGRKG